MTFNFDQWVDRSHSDSVKWNKYKQRDVIPLWVADTDFISPPAVIEALHKRVSEGVFGYGTLPAELTDLLVERMKNRYGWQIAPHWLVYLPGVVCALNLAVRAFTTEGQVCITPSPIYPPFSQAVTLANRTQLQAPLIKSADRWVMDFNALDGQLTGNEKLLLLCNPQNPGGTVYRREELEQQHKFAQQHNLVVCSDEIHSDLILDSDIHHIPFAALNPDAEQRAITLISPSKTFNLAGLGASVAIIANDELRRKFIRQQKGIIPSVNILAYVAAIAAYRDGESWLREQIAYLRDNRDWLVQRINAMPGLSMVSPEGTYLGWIDASGLAVDNPYSFFLQAGVALSPGKDFGDDRFIRINFGCTRALLEQALQRMETAILSLN
ncbi:MalY/PatB family protein [Edaphovirga cremea]|uniref:MalY/PatB family protein n=1 Tax=Edaphovirga cremea TaxID=2267246 RepID=UPI0039897E2B